MPASKDPRATVDELRAVIAKCDARYEALVTRAGYGIYRSSLDGRFLEANAVLAAILGYECAEDLLRLDLARDVYLDPGERDRLIGRPVARAFPDWVETRWKRRDG